MHDSFYNMAAFSDLALPNIATYVDQGQPSYESILET
jgi:hypothetical protein